MTQPAYQTDQMEYLGQPSLRQRLAAQEEMKACYERIAHLETLLVEARSGLIAHCFDATPETIYRIDQSLDAATLS